MPTLISRYRIIGTNRIYYAAWAPSRPLAGHSSVRTFPGHEGWWGQIGTERLPAELDALPAYSSERLHRVTIWLKARYDHSHALIRRAFPETVDAFAPSFTGELTIEHPTLPDEVRALVEPAELAVLVEAAQVAA